MIKVGDVLGVKRDEANRVWEVLEVHQHAPTMLVGLPTGERLTVGLGDVVDLSAVGFSRVSQLNDLGKLRAV